MDTCLVESKLKTAIGIRSMFERSTKLSESLLLKL